MLPCITFLSTSIFHLHASSEADCRNRKKLPDLHEARNFICARHSLLVTSFEVCNQYLHLASYLYQLVHYHAIAEAQHRCFWRTLLRERGEASIYVRPWGQIKNVAQLDNLWLDQPCEVQTLRYFCYSRLVCDCSCDYIIIETMRQSRSTSVWCAVFLSQLSKLWGGCTG